MTKIKLIASDLDGTLLLGHAKSCDPEVFSLLRELSAKGVYFVPASGRQYKSLQNLFAPVKDELIYICENGSLVMHTDQVLLKRQFEDSLAMRLCNAVLEHPECEVLISGERTCYLIPKSGSFVSYLRDELGNEISVIDRPERIEEPIIKVSYFISGEKRDEATEHFRGLFNMDPCMIVTSGNQWVDFAPPETGKGSALRVIGEELGILPEEMAAFGDNENDRTMLNFVGQPYLMKECNPTMEDLKILRCTRVEDTLREILEAL